MKDFRDLHKWVLMALGIIFLNLLVILDGSVKSIILSGFVTLLISALGVSPAYTLVPVKINKNTTGSYNFKIK